MTKTTLGFICSNKECGEVYSSENWTPKAIESVTRGVVVCDYCFEPLIIHLKECENEDK